MENMTFKQRQEIRQLEFQQAMTDFKIMFPEMDEDVIEVVLRANDGGVHATIDQLLAMTVDNLNEALRTNVGKVELKKKGPENNESTSNFPDVTKNGSKKESPVKPPKKWCPPLLGPLPSDFLRIEYLEQRIDCAEDERIALFLQNEEFLSELRINQDFMKSLDQDMSGDKIIGGADIEIFKERLRNMGKISRNKFAQLSRVFQRRKKNRSAKGILDQSASGDSMLLGGEPLLSDSLDESSLHKG